MSDKTALRVIYAILAIILGIVVWDLQSLYDVFGNPWVVGLLLVAAVYGCWLYLRRNLKPVYYSPLDGR